MATETTTKKSWVQTTPNVCGGDACIRNTRITVHGLVHYRQLGLSEQRLLEAIQGLTQDDLDAAWEYYAGNPAAFLDDRGKAKLGDVSRVLWRRFTETTEESSDALERQARCLGDNAGDAPATPDDLQGDILADLNEPF